MLRGIATGNGEIQMDCGLNEAVQHRYMYIYKATKV